MVTNDDGVNARGLWALVSELKRLGEVAVVAPSQEQSAIGTAVSLRRTVRAQKVEPLLPDVETYAVDGTPSDSVILGLGKLVKSKVSLVVSGINQGTNLGEDVHISGTVGAALQAYLRGFPAMAISAAYEDKQRLDIAAKVAGILARKLSASPLNGIFLNVNLPDLPISEIRGARITRLTAESHINTVEEDGQKDYYRMIRHNLASSGDSEADVCALAEGNISITPLYTKKFDKSALFILGNYCRDLLSELKRN
ncbi:MAG: 5'/3'-nucleotidase SurE [Dehalococcoidales bacterium]|nr:5'/3'-nucleotidase SurE [Dehalococcoidales bacterium]